MTIRHAHPSDYGRVIQHVNAWWGGREMAPMLPKLFFLHFEGTSFVAEDDEGKLLALREAHRVADVVHRLRGDENVRRTSEAQ